MIRITLRLDRYGCLAAVESRGHAAPAGAPAGYSIACASVSMLLRSVGRLLDRDYGTEVDGRAESPGDFCMEVKRIALFRRGFVRGVTEILMQGLQDVKKDYPDEIELVHTQKVRVGEKNHGT